MSESGRNPCSIPPAGHPLVRALFARMAEQRIPYDRVVAVSGVKLSVIKSWRTRNACGPNTIQAALNAVGLQALPIPRAGCLPAALAADLESIGKRHGIPTPISELMMVAAQRRPTTESA